MYVPATCVYFSGLCEENRTCVDMDVEGTNGVRDETSLKIMIAVGVGIRIGNRPRRWEIGQVVMKRGSVWVGDGRTCAT